MKQLNSIKSVGQSNFVQMGEVRLRQPMPTQKIDSVDPFVLLHHYGPYDISPGNNPFDLGPHPHRGFEPITFLIQGEQLHRDSLGNESIVKAGDVQWTTAGRGIIHAEGPTKEFVAQGGVLEGIQLWLNLPAAKKMMAANYQHVSKEDMEVVYSEDRKVEVQVVAGALDDVTGKIETQTSVNAFLINVAPNGAFDFKIPRDHEGMLYLLHGEVTVNKETVLAEGNNQLVVFNSDGDGFTLNGRTQSILLFLSGTPLKEPVASWGPYVMNNQTEIMEALRDYQQGKMGFLVP